MKGIAYLHVSSAKQAADGKDAFPRQREAVRAYCKADHVELLEEHLDPGMSGTVPLEGREGLSAALQRCAETDAGMLMVERADRLGRDLIVSEMALRAFADANVSIVTADTVEYLTNADSDPSRKLIPQVLNAVTEYERSALVAKLAAAWMRKKRNGGHSVGAYRFGKHPDRPDEAKTLARILQLRRAERGKRRMGLAQVADMLNAEGRCSRTGRAWMTAMVRDIR